MPFRSVPVFLLLFSSLILNAQKLSTVSSRWSDSFVEWDIFTAIENEDSEELEEALYGQFKLRMLNIREDFSEWDFELGGMKGTIRQKWRDDPTYWELRSYEGNIVSMKMPWQNDITEWRITDNNIALTLKSRWTNQFDEWLVDDPRRGRFYLYTLRTGDPRDWALEDTLNNEVSEAMKMAIIFVVVFQCFPKG